MITRLNNISPYWRKKIPLFIIPTILFLTQIISYAKDTVVDEPVATVNGEAITRDEFYSKLLLTTLVGENEKVLAIVGEDVKSGGLSKLKLGLQPKHIGAIGEDFTKSGMIKIAPDWWYGTLYGTCQQATNATLLMSGISNTVTGLYPHWSTYLSTTLYGNYGGGLPRSVYTGIQASQDYRK